MRFNSEGSSSGSRGRLLTMILLIFKMLDCNMIFVMEFLSFYIRYKCSVTSVRCDKLLRDFIDLMPGKLDVVLKQQNTNV